jgi:hypothetical protein
VANSLYAKFPVGTRVKVLNGGYGAAATTGETGVVIQPLGNQHIEGLAGKNFYKGVWDADDASLFIKTDEGFYCGMSLHAIVEKATPPVTGKPYWPVDNSHALDLSTGKRSFPAGLPNPHGPRRNQQELTIISEPYQEVVENTILDTRTVLTFVKAVSVDGHIHRVLFNPDLVDHGQKE